MDIIKLSRIEFYGYHGVFAEENHLGQKFIVDLDLHLNLREAGIADDITKTVHYAELYELVKGIVEGEPFKLIEALTEHIASRVLDAYTIVDEVVVRVTKPNPPFAIHFDGVTIEMTRRRGQDGHSGN